jgi:hypothetical protein
MYGDPIDPNVPITEPLGSYGWPSYPPAYAPPPYNAYSNELDRTRDRPGEVLAATVLALITSGLLLITGFIVIFAASSFDSTDDAVESSQRTTLFVGAGLLNVIVAAALIIGAVLLLGRAEGGRTSLALGALVCLALGVFWLIEDRDNGYVVVWLAVFCGPAAAAGVLACTARVTYWLKTGVPEAG